VWRRARSCSGHTPVPRPDLTKSSKPDVDTARLSGGRHVRACAIPRRKLFRCRAERTYYEVAKPF